jgi:hypothetical protein
MAEMEKQALWLACSVDYIGKYSNLLEGIKVEEKQAAPSSDLPSVDGF